MTLTHSLFLIWATAFPLVMSPGPANLSLASFGVTYGFRRSLPYLIGILLGTFAVLLLVAFGMTAVLLSNAVIVRVLSVLAVAYILYLAWTIAVAPTAQTSSAAAEVPSVWPGLGLALANPKAFAAIGAVYTGHGLFAGDVVIDAMFKIAVLTIVVIVSGTAWLAFGTLFSGMLSRPRTGRLVNVSFALILVVSAIHAVLI